VRVLLAVGLVLAALFAVVLRVPAVTTRVASFAFRSIHVLPNTRMTVGRVEPAGAVTYRLVGWRWTRGDTLLASADTVVVRAGFGWLWNTRLEVGDVDARGVVVTDALLFLRDARRPRERIEFADFLRGRFYEGPPLTIGRLRVHGGRWGRDGEDGPGRRRERIVVRALDARHVALGSRFGFELDSLRATGWPRADADSIELEMEGTLRDGCLDLPRVALSGSPGALDLRLRAALDRDDAFSELAVVAKAPSIELASLEPFFTGAGLGGRVSADVDLHGPTAARLSGHARIDGDDVRVREIDFGDARLDADVVDGRGDGTFAAQVEGASVEGTGWVRPDPSGRRALFAVRASSDGLPERWPGVTWWNELARRADARIELAASNDSGTVERVRFTAKANGPAGRLDGEGVLDLRAPRSWSVSRLDFERLDLARITGGGRPTALRGSLAGDGTFATGDTARVDLRIALAPSRVADWQVRAARANVRLRGRTIAGSLDVDSEAGSLTARTIEGRIDGDGPLRFAGVTFHDVDLARLLARPDLPTRLAGALDGSARGLRALGDSTAPLAALRDGRVTADAHVRLDASRVRAVDIASGDFDVALAGGDVRVTGTAATSGGDVELTADARPFDATPTAGVERARFARLDLAVWSGDRRLASDLNGTLEGDGRLAFDLDAPAEWRGRLALEPSTIARTPFQGGRADVSWSRGRAQWDGALFAARDSDEVKTTGTLVARRDSLAGEATLAVPVRLLARATGRDTLRARGAIHAEMSFAGRDPSTLDGQARVAGRGAVGEATLDTLGALLALRRGTLWVDTLFARSNAGTATAGGAIALFDTTARPPAFHLDATLSDASRLRPFFTPDTAFVGSGTLALTLEGPADARVLDAHGDLRAVATRQWSVFGAQLGAQGVLGRDFRPKDLTFDSDFRQVRAFGTRVKNGTLLLVANEDSMRFELEAGPDTTHRMRVAGDFATVGDTTHVRLTAYDASTDSTTWALAKPAAIDVSRGRFEVRDFDLRSDRGSVVAGGRIDRYGDQDFTVVATNVDLAGVFAWIGRKEESGTIDGTIRVQGPATEPRGTATFVFGLVAQGKPQGTIRSNLSWNGVRADVQGAFTTPAGDSLAWQGNLPLAVSLVPAPADTTPGPPPPRLFDGAIDLSVVGKAFPLASIAPFLGPSDRLALSGTLDVDVRVRGTGHALAGSGRLDVANASILMPEAGVDYRQVDLRSSFDGDRWRVEKANAMAGAGRMDASGTIQLASVTNVRPDLTVHADRFEIADTDQLHAVASGEMKVEGTLAHPKATGRVTIEDSSYEFVQSDLAAGGDTGPPIHLTPADVRQMQEVFGFERLERRNPILDLYDAADLDLAVDLGGDVWVRQRVQPTLSLPLDGEFQVKKGPGEFPRLQGTIEAVSGRGSIEQFGRTFTITEGRVDLHGLPQNHRFDLQAEFSPPSRQGDPESEATIRLDVSGQMNDMKLTLSSEPAMSQTEIVAFLATGHSRTLGRSGNAGGDPGALAADIGLSQVAGFAQSAAQEAIGLDVLQVRFDPIEGATLVAGNYIDSKLYVGFVQPFQSHDDSEDYGVVSRTSIELEEAIHRWLVLNLRGEPSQVRSFIRVRHAY
jgi:autotransporter translocation and assembly factor TamB